MSEEVTSEVVAADDGEKCVNLSSGTQFPVFGLLSTSDWVEIVSKENKCHICGQIGGH